MDVADDAAQQRIFIWTAPRLYPSNDSCTYGATQFRQADFITLCVLWGAFRISDGYNFCTVESAQKVRFGNGFNWGTNHLSLLETNEPKVCDLDHMVCRGLNMSGLVLMRCGVGIGLSLLLFTPSSCR